MDMVMFRNQASTTSQGILPPKIDASFISNVDDENIAIKLDKLEDLFDTCHAVSSPLPLADSFFDSLRLNPSISGYSIQKILVH